MFLLDLELILKLPLSRCHKIFLFKILVPLGEKLKHIKKFIIRFGWWLFQF